MDVAFYLWAVASSVRIAEGVGMTILVSATIRSVLALKLWQASDIARLLIVCGVLGIPVAAAMYDQALEPLAGLPMGVAIAWLLNQRPSAAYCSPTTTSGADQVDLVPNRRRALSVAVGLVLLAFGSGVLLGIARGYYASRNRHRAYSVSQEE